MIQITKCPCGKTFAGCMELHCYEDADYQRETRKYIAKGCKVQMVEKMGQLQNCTCKGMNPENAVNENQLNLFINE